jgi:hypothetical protein
MDLTNEVLLVQLGVAALLLGVAGEFSPPLGRALRLLAALLGVLVIVFVLLR